MNYDILKYSNQLLNLKSENFLDFIPLMKI